MVDYVNVDFNGLIYGLKAEEWNKVIPENQQILKNFDKYNKNRRENKDSTRRNNIQALVRFGKTFKKPFNELSREEINSYVDCLNIQSSSKSAYINPIKKMFKWLYDDDHPEVIKDLKIPKKKARKLKRSDLLTEDEIKKIISHYDIPSERAYVAVLYDSGCRPSELINLRRKHVSNINGVWILSVDGKTGIRNIGLNFSAQFFEPWYNQFHPYKDNSDAPLWIARANRLKNQPLAKQSYTIWTSWRILKRAEKIVNKRVFPYLCRHSRLTDLASKGLPEFKLRHFAGWEGGSKMTEVYLHASSQDTIDSVRQLDGYVEPEEIKPKKSKLLPIECPRCKNKNPFDAEYCTKCWIPLKTEMAMDELRTIEYLRSPMAKHQQDSVKLAKELDIPLYFDIEEKVRLYHESKENTRKRLINWKGSDEDKDIAIKISKKFFGEKLVDSWVT